MTKLSSHTRQYAGGLIIPNNTQDDSSPSSSASPSASDALTSSRPKRTSSDDTAFKIPTTNNAESPETPMDDHHENANHPTSSPTPTAATEHTEDSPSSINFEDTSNSTYEQSEDFSHLHHDEPTVTEVGQDESVNLTPTLKREGLVINVSGGTCNITVNTGSPHESANNIAPSTTVNSSSASLLLENILSSTDSESLMLLQDKVSYMQKVLDAKKVVLDAENSLTKGF